MKQPLEKIYDRIKHLEAHLEKKDHSTFTKRLMYRWKQQRILKELKDLKAQVRENTGAKE
jgi:hypothetical protein